MLIIPFIIKKTLGFLFFKQSTSIYLLFSFYGKSNSKARQLILKFLIFYFDETIAFSIKIFYILSISELNLANQ